MSVPEWTGTGYRLPTEAEWEYPCRAGSTTRYSFGDDGSALADHAWFDGNSGMLANKFDLTLHAVGQKLANKYGLFDTHGNVNEWCWDAYDEKYYAASPVTDPSGPSNAPFRVYRGGSCGVYLRSLRSAGRGWVGPGGRNFGNGFRVARSRSGH